MRLPIVPPLSTKDGTANKNARLTNCLKESKKTGDKAVIRPGLVLDAEASGVGGGLVSFNGELVSVYGTTLGMGVVETSSGGDYEISPSFGAGEGCKVDFVGGHYVAYYVDTNDEIFYGIWQGDEASAALFFPDYYLQTNDSPAATATTENYHFIAVTNAGTSAVWRVAISDLETFPPALSSTHSRIFEDTSYIVRSIRYLNGLLIVVMSAAGGTIVYYSSDEGDTWTSITDSGFRAMDVLHDGSVYRLYGSNLAQSAAVQKTTSDFSSFSSAVSMSGDLPTIFEGCGYIGARYVASGLEGADYRQYVSDDGVAWTRQNATLFVHDFIKCKIIGSYLYNSYEPSPGVHAVARTSDGVSWAEVCRSTNFYPFDVATDGVSFVAWDLSGQNYLVDSETTTSGTIPALTTITTGPFDFAQSPL